MKSSKISLLTFALFLVGCSSISTPAPISATQTESNQSTCYQSAMTQTEMNECASQRTQETYTELKSLIVELQGRMSAAQYTTLLKIEADLETMMTEHCKWEADFFEGGSVQTMWFSGCLGQQYSDRIEALRMNLCEGNGMTDECRESLKYKK